MKNASDQELIDLVKAALKANTETDCVEFKDAAI
jgi:hypothetical protein